MPRVRSSLTLKPSKLNMFRTKCCTRYALVMPNSWTSNRISMGSMDPGSRGSRFHESFEARDLYKKSNKMQNKIIKYAILLP